MLKGRIRKRDMETLLESTQEEDAIAAEWDSDVMRPAYIIAKDEKMQSIVVCIRGTLSTKDVCCTHSEK